MISLTSPAKTRAHGWPAGLKLALLCAATMALFQSDDLAFHLGALALTFVLYALPGRVFLRGGLAALRPLWMFVAIIAVWHAFRGEWTLGAVMVLRLMTAVALANLVTMTTRLDEMIALFKWLLTPLRPLGVNTAAIEFSMALVIRFTPVLIAKSRALLDAWRARSARRPTWRIVVPMAVVALDDADQVAEALKARGGIGPSR